jgi:hypothetical protein
MTIYHIHLLDGDGKLLTVETFEGNDDAAAKDFALTLLGTKSRYSDVELWSGGHRVFGASVTV